MKPCSQLNRETSSAFRSVSRFLGCFSAVQDHSNQIFRGEIPLQTTEWTVDIDWYVHIRPSLKIQYTASCTPSWRLMWAPSLLEELMLYSIRLATMIVRSGARLSTIQIAIEFTKLIGSCLQERFGILKEWVDGNFLLKCESAQEKKPDGRKADHVFGFWLPQRLRKNKKKRNVQIARCQRRAGRSRRLTLRLSLRLQDVFC